MNSLGTIIVEFDIANRSHRTIALPDFLTQPLDESKIYWIHYNTAHTHHFKELAQKLSLPPETKQLCQQKNTISKLIDDGQTLSLKFQCIMEKEFSLNREEHFANMVIHLTSQYCFTASSKPLPALLEFQNSYEKALRFAKTSCFILFLIMDNVVNDYAQFLFNFEVVSDQMDIKVRENHENIYSDVTDIKHRVMEIKRCTVAIREILMRVSGRKIAVVSEDCRISLYNLFNQSQMIFNEIDSIRDMLNAMLSQMDYHLMHRMNKTMQVLTAFAAVFLPLTLITGIYGMNFQNMPELHWQYGYYYAIGLIITCGSILLYLFKRMKWLD